ncbi:MAG: replicative DNA helicase [Thermodesulfobacteriota bacterium]|nr:replicative DNA helicase [Thermodesulfobacteriota bacterium]
MINDIEIEKACLSSAMISKIALLELIDKVDINDFFFAQNQIICKAMFDLYARKVDIDILALQTKLKESKQLEAIGGITVLSDLYRSVSTSMNIGYYIDQLKVLSKRRKLLEIAQDTGIKAQDTQLNIQDTITDVSNEILRITAEKRSDIYKLSEFLDIKSMREKGTYIKTGFECIDKKIYGLFNSELIILAARPSLGKTSLSLNIAQNISKHKNVLFFSLEMPKTDLAIRMLSPIVKLGFKNIKAGWLSKDQFENIEKASVELAKLNLFINDKAANNIDSIVSSVKRFNELNKVDFVVCDYLQLVTCKQMGNKELEIGHITQQFKNLGKDLNIPVMVLSQLSRAIELRKDKVPTLSDLRDSGQIEQHADTVLFLHTAEEREVLKPKVDLIVGKARNDMLGAIPLIFEKQYTRFIDIEV